MTERKIYKMKEVTKDFSCTKCGKGFTEERYLQRHQKMTTSCDKKFICQKCGKEFSTNSVLKNHLNRATSCVPESVPIINADNSEFRCHYCNKTLSTSFNLKRHQQTCDKERNMQYLLTLLMNEKDKRIEEKDKRIEEKDEYIKKLEGRFGGLPNIVNNTLNQTVNNNLYMNVTLCSFGKEDLSKLDKNKVMNLIKHHAKDFVPKMIEHVHANPDMPEYHNVFYDPERNKAIVFVSISDNEKSWQTRDFEVVSAELTQKIREYIRPGNGPYFDIAMQAKDYDTGNSIISIADHINWLTPDTHEQNKTSLSQITKNKSFLELVELTE